MQTIVAGLATIFLSLTLWADMCFEVGEFIVEEKSLDPQVAMTVNNVHKYGVQDDETGIWHTECDYYTDVLAGVWAVSYSTTGALGEVRELSIDNGLDLSGTTCTAPGIYLFKIFSPNLFDDDGGDVPLNCTYTFVSHNKECATQGIVIEKTDPNYEYIIDGERCTNTLADAVAESQGGGLPDYQIIPDNDNDYSTSGGDKHSVGCALTLL